MKIVDRGRYSSSARVFVEPSGTFRGEIELILRRGNSHTAHLRPTDARLLAYTLLAEAERLDDQKSN